MIARLLTGLVAAALAVAPVGTLAQAPKTQRQIAFTKIEDQQARGEVVGREGLFDCRTESGPPINYGSDVPLLRPAELAQTFARQMTRAGHEVAGSNSSLFKTDTSEAELELGASIFVAFAACEMRDVARSAYGMTVSWEVYDRKLRQVVLRTQTEGLVLQEGKEQTDPQLIAFDRAASRLISSQAFTALLTAPAEAAPGESREVYTQPIIKLVNNLSSREVVPISDAVGSVVAIINDDSHGSGFLVSAEGYVITNYHVVDDSKVVTVRWSDGIETKGEVVRSDKRRDVALIKTGSRDRQPLGLRTGAIPTGEEVYAIGTPIDRGFQNTVTRGIVSANRVMDGFRYLQSDVTVNGGNSGGPLIDKNGRVVAICVLGIRDEGLPTGINLFIPIRDALDFLSLEAAIPVPAS